MVRFSLSDGTTRSFDLAQPESVRAWEQVRADSAFQALIRGAQLQVGPAVHTLPMPVGFGRAVYDAQATLKDGQASALQLLCFVDKFQITLTAYLGKHPFTRCDVKRIGRMRHIPGPRS